MVAEQFVSNKVDFRKRREELRRIIEEIGLWNVNKTALAKKFGVTESQIRSDIKKIIKKIPADKLREPAWEFFHAYKKAQKELRKIIVQGNTKEKIMAIRELINLGDKFTKLLEDYGLKDKIAEKIEIKGDINAMIEGARESKKWLDEIKKLKEWKKKNLS